jgi:hypothetical protein
MGRGGGIQTQRGWSSHKLTLIFENMKFWVKKVPPERKSPRKNANLAVI